MNNTFMFGEDNFVETEDFSKYYHKIGGALPADQINHIIRLMYSFLDERYPDEKYRHAFPSLEVALKSVINQQMTTEEINKIIDTFAHHEMGYIPTEYVDVLHKLSENYKMAVVIDIWSPKDSWVGLFKDLGIAKLFSAVSFSSDHGVVKPSPKPYELVIKQLDVDKDQCLVIGDSIRRDLGGAEAAGLDCVLVGGARHENAVGCCDNLLDFSAVLKI